MNHPHMLGTEVAACAKPVHTGSADDRKPTPQSPQRAAYGIFRTRTIKVWHFRTAMMIWFVAVVLVSATLTVQAERHRDHTATAGALPRPPASPTQTSASTACLESLATAVAATTPDPPGDTRYTYHHLAWWTADDTIRPGVFSGVFWPHHSGKFWAHHPRRVSIRRWEFQFQLAPPIPRAGTAVLWPAEPDEPAARPATPGRCAPTSDASAQ